MAKFYLTTAIDYVNSRPHLGTAYEKIAADVIARYKRLCGVETRFMMGNDEHSQNVFQRARELGVEPLAFCDGMETAFRDVWARLDISFDDFIRTTEARHRTSVTALVSRLADAGDIYDGYYEGWYCVSCEAFKPEKDLDDGNCPVHGKPPQWIKEEESLLPAFEVPAAPARSLRGPSGVPASGDPPQRDAQAARGGARRHLDEPDRSGVGASRCRRIPRAWSTSGSTRSSTTSRGSGTGPTRRCSRPGGRPTCM